MKKISFKYRPIKSIDFYLAKSRLFPECYSEVSDKQFNAYESLFFGEINDVQFISIVFNVPMWIARRCTDFLKYTMLDCFEFMKDEAELRAFLSARKINTRLNLSELLSPIELMIRIELEENKKESTTK